MKNNQVLTVEGIRLSMLRERTTIRTIFLIILLFLVLFYFILEWQPSVLIFILLGYSSAYIGFMLALNSSSANQTETLSDLIEMQQQHMGGLGMVYGIASSQMEYVAPSITRILGFKPVELTSRFSTFLFHPKDRKSILSVLQQIEFQQIDQYRLEVLVLQKEEGGYLPMELYAQAAPVNPDSGLVEYIVLTLNDLSQIKAKQLAEKQLTIEWMQKANALPQLTSEYTMLEELMTSHDLKEPLRTVKSYADLLQDKYQDGLDPKGKECLNYITNGIDRMMHIIEDVALFAKCDAYNTVFSPVDVIDVLNRAMSRNTQLIREHQAIISFKDLPEIKGDSKQLTHLFQNLIANAIKYRSEAVPNIEVSCRLEEGFWHFIVQDNGIGIRPEFQHSIFDLFQRLPAAKTSTGSGVGLAICKRIIENHRGKIWVSSEGEGFGSTFHFTIPVSVGDHIQIKSAESFSYS